MFRLSTLIIASCFHFSGIVVAQSPSPGQLILPAKTCTLSFQWLADTTTSPAEPHAAMLIPVRLKHCPRTFYLQFDLGAPASLLYRNKIDAIRKKYPSAIPQQAADGILQYISLKAGKTMVNVREISVKQFDSTAINWNRKSAIEIIGTFGADLIDGRVVAIDYPNCTITLSDSLSPRQKENLTLVNFMYTNRRVLLPAIVNGKATILYFDTGSSMFSLLTSKETSQQLAIPGALPVRQEVNSWGKLLTAYTLSTNAGIDLANTSLPLQATTWIEGVSDAQVAQMLRMGIGGMTGNKLFLDHVLVLDTKNHLFGLKLSSPH
ncbi:hypothetical protein [Flavihumibacter petaseus]|uniref:Aspartyl protease n=1 Tax=Flavihumibacter petaseus NBRC 106054 TaxID=1220578 RepID=A0A0E9N412_9BACT|nr:hypothetical protein [Flavihumibacter petaseus]GAO44722.1 hypothetical protein FPE01S_03_07610 [Flavihumibacter petaseus NBRC 106054]